MTGPSVLGQLRWPDLDGRSVTLLVPLGSTEQHGPHLALDTDTAIAEAVAEGVQRHLGDPALVRAPMLSYGASGEHEGFPGTVSIGHEALRLLLVEYGRSACRWAGRVVFVNGHGGNGPTLRESVQLLRYEGRDAAWFPCSFAGADAHAGFTETSVLLHVSPERVRLAEAAVGNAAPVGALLDDMRAGGVAAVSRNGVLGDPTAATADDGRRLQTAVVTDLAAALTRWQVDDGGRLR